MALNARHRHEKKNEEIENIKNEEIENIKNEENQKEGPSKWSTTITVAATVVTFSIAKKIVILLAAKV